MTAASELRAIARTLVMHHDDPRKRAAAIVALYGVAAEVETMERTAMPAETQRVVGPLPPNVVDARNPEIWRAA